MATQIEIKTEPRKQGKSTSRSLRMNRRVPAVVYGPNLENTNFSIALNDATKYSTSKFENTIFALSSDNKEINGISVIRKQMTVHPVTRMPVHLDFYAIQKGSKIKVQLEIKFVGTAIGTKEGGNLTILKHDIDIEVLPSQIPENIEIDITNLNIDDTLHVSDLKIPDGVTVLSGLKEAIIKIEAAKQEEVVAEETPAATEAAPAATAEDAASKDKDKK